LNKILKGKKFDQHLLFSALTYVGRTIRFKYPALRRKILSKKKPPKKAVV
jgi:hypothetical protein